MKLFLTSTIFLNDKVTKEVFKYINKPISECKVLFIPNEKATFEILNTRKYLDRVNKWGFSENNIYIFNKYEVEKYRNLNIDIITVGGGNTFETLNIIRKCNFDKDIINYVKNGVIYIGGSCGSHIVTSNIKHLEKYDENSCNIKDYDGLNLFNGILICHYDKDRENDYKKLLNDKKFNIYTLKDNEFLICDNNKIEKKQVLL